MARIYNLKINNFRGIQALDQTFGDARFVCLIGRGDSGKTTILDAIYSVLSPNWSLSFSDNDFHNCDIKVPIQIEASLVDLPEELLREDKYGLHIRGLDKKTQQIIDEIEDHHEKILTIRLEVKRDLEPRWFVVNSRQDPLPISARDRERLNVGSVSDYVDRHFSWSRGNPLSTLLKQDENYDEDEGEALPVVEALRGAKSEIDRYPFSQFEGVMNKIKAKAAGLGIDITKAKTTIDFRDISIKDGKVSLHEDLVPFRVKGKGSRRLISIAIQLSLIESYGILLIDEVEQGLEPDRVQHLVSHLKKNINGQIFITTHSRDVLVELEATDLFIFRHGEEQLRHINVELQGCCRNSPEAFFAHRIVVCEGPTEIGICRALNDYRVGIGLSNTSLKGVRFINGGGSNMISYTNALDQAAFKTSLFCDADTDLTDSKIVADKEALRTKNIPVFDWEKGDCLEVAIFKDISFDALLKCLKLAKEIVMKEDNLGEDVARTAIKDAIASRLPSGSLNTLTKENDSKEIRAAVGSAASKKMWYKDITRGQELGKIIFEDFGFIKGKKLGLELEALSKWIDNG